MVRSSRRNFMLGGLGLTAAATAASSLFAGPVAPRGDLPNAILIDGQGGPFDAGDTVAVMNPQQIADLKRSGMNAYMVTISDVSALPAAWDNTIAELAHYNALITANPTHFVLALSAADIRSAKASNRVALVYGTENTTMIGADLDKVGVLKGLGVRTLQLTYNIRNMSGDGALEPANAGLSTFGRSLIHRIEQEHLLLDLSHGGERTILEAVETSTQPMSINHTGCKALADHPRNVTDAALRAVSNKGGVTGIYFMPYLTSGRPPKREDVVAHLVHAVEVAGEDHVGIGTDGYLEGMVIDAQTRAATAADFETRKAQGIAAPGESADFFPVVEDYNSPDRMFLLADDLLKRGWSSSRIDKVLGGNFLRVYAAAWGG